LITTGWILLFFPIVVGIYAYAAYPLLLKILPRRGFRRAFDPDQAPMVSIVIPAYNEEAQIRGAIDAATGQDYPAHRRQILILSDASTDRTDDIVREYASKGVELLRMPVRSGKTAAENASIPHLRGEIIINTDSSVRLHPTAVRRLIEAMVDPVVGVASTRDVSIARAATSANATEAGYVDYEMRIRGFETLTGGIVGASGSGYAIRAELHHIPVRADLSRDFSAALTARTHGFAAVSVDDALCYVPRTTSLRAEYRRKVRTIARGMETLAFNKHLLDPIEYGAFAWKLLSHKVARWLLPVSAVAGAVGLALLGTRYVWAAVIFALGVLATLLALAVALYPWKRPIPRALSLLAFGVAGNVAVVHALGRVLLGHEDHLWEPTRRAPVASPADGHVEQQPA
jgi:cellulose synthase/poly-beta-1,6-N-acetylglucosamine synthase-like glycosyltransferase